MFGKSKSKELWLIAGLGNPGDKYAYTWHNCGFLAVEMLADKYDIVLNKDSHKAILGKGKIEDKDVIIAKPQTFMNNSGESIAKISSYYKISPDHIIIIYDDIDIMLGKIRVRPSGSAGTHNGMKSIINLLGTSDFPRVRIGYGPVPEKWSLIDFVLSDIPKDKRESMWQVFHDACDETVKWINEH